MYILRSRRVIVDGQVGPADVAVSDGVIGQVAEYGSLKTGTIQDVGDLAVMPGVFDPHVHFNEPGRTHWEGFFSGTQAAALGGITSVVDMPLNSIPVTTSADAFGKKVDAATGQLFVNCGFYGGVVPGNGDDLPGLVESGVLGLKAFLVDSGIDEFPAIGSRELRQAMTFLSDYDLPLLAHCELPISNGATPIRNPRKYTEYLASRPESWERQAIKLMLDLCRKTGCRIHIVHLAAASCLDILQEARSDGLPVTVETCPHYLYFDAEAIPDGSTAHKCAPPIRSKENAALLWEALESGDIDFVASDHSPAPPKMKRLDDGNLAEAWGGIASIQLTLPIMWTLTRRHGLGLADVTRWMSTRTSEFAGFGDRKGKIAEGFDADLVIWNPDVELTVEAESLASAHKVCPYIGQTLYGSVVSTLVAGEPVVHDGKILETPRGKTLLHRS